MRAADVLGAPATRPVGHCGGGDAAALAGVSGSSADVLGWTGAEGETGAAGLDGVRAGVDGGAPAREVLPVAAGALGVAGADRVAEGLDGVPAGVEAEAAGWSVSVASVLRSNCSTGWPLSAADM